jgi:alkaline phosphatase D
MDFQNQPVDNMVAVGVVRADSARLWLRAEKPGPLTVRWWPESLPKAVGEKQIQIAQNNDNDNTAGFEIPGKDGADPPLAPLTRYRFQVLRHTDGFICGSGSFETAPAESSAPAEEFSIALMSCHQPFDDEGRLLDRSIQMLRATRTCLRQENTKLVLMVGDQIYSDYPKPLSLFDPQYFQRVAPPARREVLDCSPAEVRALFHRRYRHFFGIPEWQRIHAEFPVCPILDDHDLVDNWGSADYFEKTPWQRFGQGARAAYFDYQGKRVLPDPGVVPEDFDTSLVYGSTATYLLDIRSNRTGGEEGQLFSLKQANRFREFLETHQDKKVIFVVLSVPIIHLPRKLARFLARLPPPGEDFSDRWSTGPHIRDRDRFLRIIMEHRQRHPHQQVLFLSGDIHIACVHKIQWRNGPVAYQVVSSGFTHLAGAWMRAASKLLIRMNRSFATCNRDIQGRVRLVKGIQGRQQNPYGNLNLGLVKVRINPADHEAQLRFQIYGHDGETPRCVYESAVIR